MHPKYFLEGGRTVAYRVIVESIQYPGAYFCSKRISTKEEAVEVKKLLSDKNNPSQQYNKLRDYFGSALPTVTDRKYAHSKIEEVV